MSYPTGQLIRCIGATDRRHPPIYINPNETENCPLCYSWGEDSNTLIRLRVIGRTGTNKRILLERLMRKIADARSNFFKLATGQISEGQMATPFSATSVPFVETPIRTRPMKVGDVIWWDDKTSPT